MGKPTWADGSTTPMTGRINRTSSRPGSDLDLACPFCLIANGLDPAADIVCETDQWVAFFPLQPATPGHTLVIPRAHVPDIWSLDVPVASTLMPAVIRVGKAIESALRPDGMNLISSAGSAAEQTVFHAHLHVVPRWKSDPIGPIWPPKERMSDAAKDNLAVLVREACE